MRSKTAIKTDILSSEITPEADYINRRQFIYRSGQTAMGLCLPYQLALAGDTVDDAGLRQSPLVYSAAETPYRSNEKQTPFVDATSYNNFYEFGTDKSDPKRYASAMTISPWSVDISGEVEKPGRYHLEDIIRPHALQERVYRLRCVEAWSMVNPWEAFPLADRLYLTRVHSEVEGDTYLEGFKEKDWIEISRETFNVADHEGHNYSICILEKR